MKWLKEIEADWQEQYPERDFDRVRPLVRLSRLSLLMPDFQKKVLAPHDLGTTDYSILSRLRRAGRPRPLGPGDLYSTLGCTPGGLSKMIDRLVGRGLVKRLVDRGDARRARIGLTAKGARVGRDAFDDYHDASERLMSRLTPEQLDHIDSALEMLLDCFEPPEEEFYRSPFRIAETAAGLRDSR